MGFILLFSRNFDSQLSPNFHILFIFFAYLEIPSENIGLWQLAKVSSAFICTSVCQWHRATHNKVMPNKSEGTLLRLFCFLLVRSQQNTVWFVYIPLTFDTISWAYTLINSKGRPFICFVVPIYFNISGRCCTMALMNTSSAHCNSFLYNCFHGSVKINKRQTLICLQTMWNLNRQLPQCSLYMYM